MITNIIKILWCLIMLILAASMFTNTGNVRRPDDLGYNLYSKGKYKEASQTFTNSEWQAIALYRAGDFKAAANIFAGYDTPEGCFNHGNALVFQGNEGRSMGAYSHSEKVYRNVFRADFTLRPHA